MKQVADAFHAVSIGIVILPFLAGIINYKGLNRDSRWILGLVLAALVPQLLTWALRPHHPLLNLSYNLYTPVEIGILYLLFYPRFKGSNGQRLVRASALLCGLLFVFLAVRYGLTENFLNWAACACNVMAMFWILLLIRQEYNAEETFIAKGNPFTWYLMGYAFYAPGRVATLALYRAVHDYSNPWLISLDSLFNILLYVFMTVGLLIRRPG